MVTNSKSFILAASLLFLSSCEDGGFSGIGGGGCDQCVIFVSATGSNGNLGGVSGADGICAADANKPASGTFKALVGAPGVRQGTIGSQIDWVLKPSTQYVRKDGTLIATTDTDGLIQGALTNSISAIAVAGGIMTGLSDNGTPQQHCQSWTSGLVGDGVSLGVAISPDQTAWVNNSASTCNTTTRKIYCVQQ